MNECKIRYCKHYSKMVLESLRVLHYRLYGRKYKYVSGSLMQHSFSCFLLHITNINICKLVGRILYVYPRWVNKYYKYLNFPKSIFFCWFLVSGKMKMKIICVLYIPLCYINTHEEENHQMNIRIWRKEIYSRWKLVLKLEY